MRSGWWILPMAVTGSAVWIGTAHLALDYTVTHDMGGSISARVDEVALAHSVRIVGTCYSACTMLLGAKEVCVTRDAKLGFHSPRTRSGLPLPLRDWEQATMLMADYYPPKLRDWFIEVGRKSSEVLVVSGAELIAMGVAECGNSPMEGE